MELKPGYGMRLAAVRMEAGLSKHAFALKVLSERASAQNIGRLEKESVVPRLATLLKIAEHTGCNLAWLVTGQASVEENLPLRVPGIGRRIEEARHKKGLSQRALANLAHLGDSAKNVGRIEQREVQPLWRTVLRLARALKVAPEQLVYGVAA